MKPDWESKCGTIRLYNADCRDVLPFVKCDAVITDPPYGIDYGRGGGFSATHGWGPWRENVEWDAERPPKEIFDSMLALQVPTIILGGNYFTDYVPPASKWLIWDKGQTDFSLADCEVAWCSFGGAIRRLMYPRALALRDGKVHPTQKPLAVIDWCIKQLPKGCGTIADFFMGSGTTAVSCVRAERSFIGCEINADYFAKAIIRIEAELKRAPLFDAPRIEQTTMFEETTPTPAEDGR